MTSLQKIPHGIVLVISYEIWIISTEVVQYVLRRRIDLNSDIHCKFMVEIFCFFFLFSLCRSDNLSNFHSRHNFRMYMDAHMVKRQSLFRHPCKLCTNGLLQALSFWFSMVGKISFLILWFSCSTFSKYCSTSNGTFSFSFLESAKIG